MENLCKIVWTEGIFLGQQHFQQWDRYQEKIQRLIARSLNPLAWGILQLTIDHQALENGRLRVEKCLALFPDGRLAAYDAASDPALMCELAGSGGETIDVYLCLPGNRQVAGISGYPNEIRHCAWEADYREIADEYDASREREVLMARPNLKLLTGEDSKDAFVSFRIARVLNEGDGTYRLHSDFIPPVCCLSASNQVRYLLGSMVELVGARLRSLNDRKVCYTGGATEFAQSDFLHFQLLQILEGLYPLLKHFQQNEDLHPEFLYRSLIPVLGQLRALSNMPPSFEVPSYRQDALDQVFPALFHMLEQLVQVETVQISSNMELQKENACLWQVSGLESTSFQRAELFLEVDHPGEDPNWINDFVRQTKVGPRSEIDLMVASALPGVRIAHVQRPPTQLSVRSGCEYFRLEQRGNFWEAMCAEGSVALFVSGQFSEATISLVRVQE